MFVGRWFAAGVLASSFAVLVAVLDLEGDPYQLVAPQADALGDFVQSELGGRQLNPSYAHDGHRSFAIASDLTGKVVPDLMLDPAYRYQRILYPAMAAALGLIGGPPLFWSMVVWAILAFGVASGAVASLVYRLDLPALSPLVVVANPALWLSVQYLTPDIFAFAAFLLGLVALLDRARGPMTAFLALSCLAKEAFVLAVLALALREWLETRNVRRVLPFFLGTVPAGAWYAYLQLRMPEGLVAGSALSAPFVGVLTGLPSWTFLGSADLVFGILSLLALCLGIATVFHRQRRWWTLCWPWLVIALVTSQWVWQVPSNALRIVAPVTVFAVLNFMDSSERLHEALSTGGQTADGNCRD